MFALCEARLRSFTIASKLCPFAFVTRRIEYKHLRCAQNKTYYELNLSFFPVFLCLCKFNRNSKFKCIINANTQNIRITNADGQGNVIH